MTKGDNLGNTNFNTSLTILLLENCKMGKMAGSFYSIKNKPEKNKKYKIDWGHTVNLVWGEKAQRWLGIWELADWIYFISGQGRIYRDKKVN